MEEIVTSGASTKTLASRAVDASNTGASKDAGVMV
jgi:hypothetical protein